MTGGLAIRVAVYVQDLTGDVGRGLQEQDAVHDVADLADPAERGKPVAEAFVAFRRVDRGLDDAGETALTRMPQEAYSMASDRVAAARPPLVSAARTAGVPEFAESATVAETLTTWPPCRVAISAMARCVSQKNPVRLTPDHAGVVSGGVVGERLGDEDARVVDEGVDAAEPSAALRRRPGRRSRGRRCHRQR